MKNYNAALTRKRSAAAVERPGYDLFSRTQKGRDVMGMGIVEAIFQLESRDHHDDDSNYSEALCVVQDYIREIVAREQKLRSAIQKTLDENGHLADGEICTLIELKRALRP